MKKCSTLAYTNNKDYHKYNISNKWVSVERDNVNWEVFYIRQKGPSLDCDIWYMHLHIAIILKNVVVV